MARQKHLEKSAYDVALERLQQQNEKLDSIGVANPALTTSTIQQWMWDWHQKLGVRIQNTINELQLTETEALGKRVPRKATALTPFLTLVKAERLSLITILEVMMLQGSSGLTDGMKTTRAVVSVGKAVEMEYKAQLARKHQPSKETASASSTENTSEGSSNPDRRSDIYSQLGYTGLRQRRLANATRVKDSEQWSSSWPQALRSKIGGILVDCLMEVAEVQRTIKDKKTGETM
jgi:DNA-directed RNA polymerase